jgi:branched-subunit amino acid permease
VAPLLLRSHTIYMVLYFLLVCILCMKQSKFAEAVMLLTCFGEVLVHVSIGVIVDPDGGCTWIS